MGRTTIGKVLDKHLDLPDEVEKYSYEDAIRLTRFAIKVNPHEPSLYFHLACYYSAVNRISKSLFYYERSLRRGFNDWHQVHTDPSFANARNTTKFNVITAIYSAK